MGFLLYLDTILVPSSLFLTIGYHALLWHCFKTKPSLTTIGMNVQRRRAWLQQMSKGDSKKAMLAVQSLRNTLISTILTAWLVTLMTLAMGALINNTYNAGHLFSNKIFGSQSGMILMLKYGSVSLFLLASFLCSSVALGCLIDANFLINAPGEFSPFASGHTERMLERGFLLAVAGNRVLCIAIPLLLWMFGPVLVLFSSMALVWGLYILDFASMKMKCSVENTSC
ncbi:hypothetical protein NMG60_11000054 [Bertholletia excelsa]